MAKIANRVVSNVFKQSIGLMWNGEDAYKNSSTTKFICWATERVASEEISSVCKGIIMQRLYPYHSLDEWLLRKHGILVNSESLLLDRKKLQATRCAWLKNLVEEFDKPGYYEYD